MTTVLCVLQTLCTKDACALNIMGLSANPEISSVLIIMIRFKSRNILTYCTGDVTVNSQLTA